VPLIYFFAGSLLSDRFSSPRGWFLSDSMLSYLQFDFLALFLIARSFSSIAKKDPAPARLFAMFLCI